MYLQAYKYTIRYQPRIKNAADLLSQSSSQQAPKENPGEQHVHHIINQDVPGSIKLSDIITESTNDEPMKLIVTLL